MPQYEVFEYSATGGWTRIVDEARYNLVLALPIATAPTRAEHPWVSIEPFGSFGIEASYWRCGELLEVIVWPRWPGSEGEFAWVGFVRLRTEPKPTHVEQTLVCLRTSADLLMLLATLAPIGEAWRRESAESFQA